MQQKTTNAANAIQRNLLIEILATIPLMIGVYAVCLYINYHPPMSFWVAVLLVTFGGHLNLYFFLSKGQYEHETTLLRLEKQLKAMYNFIQMYRIMEVLAAILTALSILLLWHTLAKDNFWVLPAYMIVAAFTAVGSFVSVRWYAGKLYGQHYNTILRTYQVLKNQSTI